MNVFTEISTRELENTLKGKAVRYIVNDAGEGLCLFFEGLDGQHRLKPR